MPAREWSTKSGRTSPLARKNASAALSASRCGATGAASWATKWGWAKRRRPSRCCGRIAAAQLRPKGRRRGTPPARDTKPTQNQPARQTDNQPARQTSRQANNQVDSQPANHATTNRQTIRQTHNQTASHPDTQSDTQPDNQPSKQPINHHDRQPAGLWWSAMKGHQGICNSLLHLAAGHKQSAIPYKEMRFLRKDRQNPRGIPHWGLLFDAAATSTQRNGGPLISMILRLCTILSCSHRVSRLCTSRSRLLFQDYSRAE